MGSFLKQFSFEELAGLDGGRIAIAVNQALKRAAADCEDRPAETRARTVLLQMEMVPVQEPDGSSEEVKIAFQIKESLPTRKTKKYQMGLRKNGVLTFNPEAPDALNQSTIFDGGEDDES